MNQTNSSPSPGEKVKIPAVAHVFCGWPIILIIIGGAIGGGLGAVAYFINLAIYKSRLHTPIKIMLNVLAGLSAFGIWLTVTYGIQNEISEDDINTVLVRTADELNKRLPDMVDENTILEATSGYDMQFSYFYTLVNYSINEIDVDAFENQMKANLINGVCNSRQLEPFVSKGVTITYVYADKDRKEFTTISVKPTECDGEKLRSNPE